MDHLRNMAGISLFSISHYSCANRDGITYSKMQNSVIACHFSRSCFSPIVIHPEFEHLVVYIVLDNDSTLVGDGNSSTSLCKIYPIYFNFVVCFCF